MKNGGFISILYNIQFMKKTKPKLKIGHGVRISNNAYRFRKGYNPQLTDEIFKNLAVFTKKPPTYIIKDLEKEEILGKFYEKELRKSSDES